MPGEREVIPGHNWPGRTLEYVTRQHARAAYRAAMRKKAMRPGYWSPENVAAKIADGMTRIEIARQGEIDCGKRVHASALVRDIYAWEASPEWGPLFRTAADTTVDPADTSWWNNFFRAMDDTEGNLRESCRIAGVAPRLVWTMTDPRFTKRYNKDFAERVAEYTTAAQATIAGAMIENLKRPGADPKTQLAYLKATSPHHFQERVSHTVKGTIQHTVSPQDQIAAASRAKQLRPAPIEECVVEAEYVEVEG